MSVLEILMRTNLLDRTLRHHAVKLRTVIAATSVFFLAFFVAYVVGVRFNFVNLLYREQRMDASDFFLLLERFRKSVPTKTPLLEFEWKRQKTFWNFRLDFVIRMFYIENRSNKIRLSSRFFFFGSLRIFERAGMLCLFSFLAFHFLLILV